MAAKEILGLILSGVYLEEKQTYMPPKSQTNQRPSTDDIHKVIGSKVKVSQ